MICSSARILAFLSSGASQPAKRLHFFSTLQLVDYFPSFLLCSDPLECGDRRRFGCFSFLECGDRRRFGCFSFFGVRRSSPLWLFLFRWKRKKTSKAATIAALKKPK